MSDITVEMACEVVRDEKEEKSILIRVRDAGEHWIPRSQIKRLLVRKQDDGSIRGRITMTAWIAQRRGLLGGME